MTAQLLVVDDEPRTAELTAEILRRAGYSVDVAGSGTEALERGRLASPDLMLLDYEMPDMKGEPSGGGLLTTLVFSTDGKLLITGGETGVIAIWDVRAQRLKRILEREAAGVTCLAVSRDGRSLACGTEDGSVILRSIHEVTTVPRPGRK